MSMETIVSYVDAKGKPFNLVANKERVARELQEFIDVEDSGDDEYALACCQMVGHHDTSPTLEERQADKEELKNYLSLLTEEGNDAYWNELLDKLDRKKNGTLAKSRVYTLFIANSFGNFWEDSYGWNVPQLRIKNLADDTAELSFDSFIVGY